MLDIAFIRGIPGGGQGRGQEKTYAGGCRPLAGRRSPATRADHRDRTVARRAQRHSKKVSGTPPDEREALLAETRALTAQLKHSETTLAPLETEFERLMLQIPNVPAPDVPEELTDADNVEIRRWN